MIMISSRSMNLLALTCRGGYAMRLAVQYLCCYATLAVMFWTLVVGNIFRIIYHVSKSNVKEFQDNILQLPQPFCFQTKGDTPKLTRFRIKGTLTIRNEWASGTDGLMHLLRLR